MSISSGTRIDRYELVEALGEGGIATVYKAVHTDLGTHHALKLLKHRSGAIAKRMLQEGRIQAQLRHPNIVGVTDVVRFDGGVGLVMDYVDGVSLAMLAYNYTLTEPQLDNLAHELFDAVEAAHRLGLVHRDLKPDNVMMAFESDRLVAKVMDFGLAKAMRDELRVGKATRAGQMMGTPQFMAPEQYRDAASVDGRADLFSLGAMLYELVCGEPLFPDEDDLPVVMAKSMAGEWVRLEDRETTVPRRWIDAIHTCLAVDADDRPADVAALRELWGPRPRPAEWTDEHRAFVRKLQAIPVTIDTLLPGPQPSTNVPRESQPPLPPPAAGPSRPSRPSRGGLGVMVLGLSGVGMGVGIGVLALLLAVGLWWWQPWAEVPVDDEVAAVAPEPVPEPAAVPVPAPPEPPPAPAQPAPAAAAPTPAPAAPTPAPVPATQPEVVQVPAPAPTPVPVPAAAPEPEGPTAATRDPSMGRVVLPGLDGYLSSPDGAGRFPLDAAPPGTYDLYVFFDAQVPTLTESVTLTAGQTKEFSRCDTLAKRCK